MEQISFYLEKFKTLGAGERLVKKTVADAVHSLLRVSIPLEDITIKKNGVACLKNIEPALRAELFMRHTEVLLKMKEALGPKAPSRVR